MSDILPAGPGGIEPPTIGLEGREGIQQPRGLGVAAGDWVRVVRGAPMQGVRAEWSATQGQWRYLAGMVDYPERDLSPCGPPAAPAVVDVPQPIVKRCSCPDIHDDVEAEWRPGEPYLTVTHTTVPLALLRAMLKALDAQQGGAS